jgi:hypothetical protein
MYTQYKEFLSNIAEVELLSRQVKNSTDREYASMVKNHQSLIENGLEQHSSSLHNMFFRSLANGKPVFYDHMTLDFDCRVKDLINRRNKNYLWLLADAFEYFENLVELMYAHIGYKEPTAWPTKETKGETPASLATKPFEWFLQKSESNKKLSAKLECIRKRFPTLAVAEKSNYFGIDFRFTMCLIEMLRHIIVHNSGQIIDFQKFVARTFEQAGIANNGNYDPQKLQLINNFVVPDGNFHRIVMLEVQQQGTPFHIDRLGAIINWLLAYADHIYRLLIQPTYFPSVES